MGRRDERTDRRHEAPRAKPEETPRPGADDRTAFARSPHLRLPETPVREPIEHGRHQYRLNGEETRILATVGAFRVIPATDLDGASRDTDVWNGPIRALADQGLVERRTLVINEQPTAVVALTREGKSLLDASQDGGRDGARQQYHAGLVKPRELAHDSQLLRLYQHAAARLEGEGHRVERVVLDYELKRDYQAFLNRAERSSDVDTDMRAFAEARQLPIVDGHLELPDLRIEYETPEGAIEYRDVELVTEHYSRGQLAGKAQAGFSLYRAAGTAKVRGGSTRTGGTPVDPHHLEWLR
jgi:hypothetical protein